MSRVRDDEVDDLNDFLDSLCDDCHDEPPEFEYPDGSKLCARCAEAHDRKEAERAKAKQAKSDSDKP
jgi:hypothetical protein